MCKTRMTAVLTLILMMATIGAAVAADEKPATAPMKIKDGEMAPDFALLALDGKELKKISLIDYRGLKNVALAFYVFAFTPT